MTGYEETEDVICCCKNGQAKLPHDESMKFFLQTDDAHRNMTLF